MSRLCIELCALHWVPVKWCKLSIVAESVVVAMAANQTTHIEKESVTMKHVLVLSVLASALFLSAGVTLAADPAAVKEKAQVQKQEQVYGSQLMTRKERAEHRTKLRNAKTTEEREQIRNEHHERMQERAKARGVMLPAAPPVGGGGMGPGGGDLGPGAGRMGSGSGMGSGGSR